MTRKMSSLATACATLLLAGSAFASPAPAPGGFRIESEAQFLRDYGDQLEAAAPGVYQVVRGPFAGKTVALGDAGLRYDLAALRARAGDDPRTAMKTRALVRKLEATQARIATARAGIGTDTAKLSTSGLLFCRYFNGTRTISYTAQAWLEATTGYYLDNGSGGYNFYYARALANATGFLSRPIGVPQRISLIAETYAANRISGQTVTRNAAGVSSVSANTGYVYSSPDFAHDLYALATVSGTADCAGYVSISDSLH
jgi:hypothetical protein